MRKPEKETEHERKGDNPDDPHEQIDARIPQGDGNLGVLQEPGIVIQKNKLLRQGKPFPARGADIKHIQQGPEHESKKPEQAPGQ